MKIYASKLDDLRRAKEEWEAEDARRKAIRDEEEKRYRKARDAELAPIEYEISKNLKRFDKLNFEITAEPAARYRGETGAEVRILCNQNRVHDENSALSWDWSVKLDGEGNVIKDSGSWSGLNATTQENMDSLMETYLALQYLNSVNWKSLLNVSMPEYSDYFTEESSKQPNKPNFNQQIKEAEFEEYIGKDTMLLGYSLPEYESRWNRSVPTWFIILGETPKQYKIGEVTAYEAKRWFEDGSSLEEIIERGKRYPSRIRKDRLLDTLKYPYIELSEETVSETYR